MSEEKVRGKIVIEILESGTPVVNISGLIEAFDINPAVFELRRYLPTYWGNLGKEQQAMIADRRLAQEEEKRKAEEALVEAQRKDKAAAAKAREEEEKKVAEVAAETLEKNKAAEAHAREVNKEEIEMIDARMAAARGPKKAKGIKEKKDERGKGTKAKSDK